MESIDERTSLRTPFKLLPGFIGGKARWTRHLKAFDGKQMVEPFAGSAAISFALAAPRPIWCEIDPVLARILEQFPDQIVPEVFTLNDYYNCRSRTDWWRYAYCLSRMSFAGVFRHTPAGFTVPPDKRLAEVRLRPAFERSLARWKELEPRVHCRSWVDLEPEAYLDRVVIVDPPFKGSKTAYNHVDDYRQLWDSVQKIRDLAEAVVCFEYADVLARLFPGQPLITRISRPNGKKAVRAEGMVIFRRGEAA